MKNEKNSVQEYAKMIANALGGIVVETTKTNGITLTGISSNASGISPIFYVNNYFEDDVPIDLVVDECRNFFSNYAEASFDTDFLNNVKCFDNVKNLIAARIVNRELNTNLRVKAPFRDVMGDLTVFYYIVLDRPESDSYRSILISNSWLSLWNITES